ncbi:MAG: hypothetical protein HC888_16190 [Candidatus Competibacteraceae bacterium]|nr:hypothetical protein [Candidatus Competibacteraceae bacterium]
MMIWGLIRVSRQVKIKKEDENNDRYKRKKTKAFHLQNGTSAVCFENQIQPKNSSLAVQYQPSFGAPSAGRTSSSDTRSKSTRPGGNRYPQNAFAQAEAENAWRFRKPWSQIKGWRVNLPGQNLVMFNRKGSKDVCVLNTKTKQYYLGPVQDWHYNTSGTALISPSDASQLKIVSRQGEDLQGIKTIKIKLSGETIEQTPAEMRKHRWQRLIVKEGELWSMPGGAISKESALMASRLLATPRTESYPLQLYLYKNTQESKPSKVLELLSWKTARVEKRFLHRTSGLQESSKRSGTIRSNQGQPP